MSTSSAGTDRSSVLLGADDEHIGVAAWSAAALVVVSAADNELA